MRASEQLSRMLKSDDFPMRQNRQLRERSGSHVRHSLPHVLMEVPRPNCSLKARDYGWRIQERGTDPRKVRDSAIIGFCNNMAVTPFMDNCIAKVSKFLQIVPVSTHRGILLGSALNELIEGH